MNDHGHPVETEARRQNILAALDLGIIGEQAAAELLIKQRKQARDVELVPVQSAEESQA